MSNSVSAALNAIERIDMGLVSFKNEIRFHTSQVLEHFQDIYKSSSKAESNALSV